MEILFADDDLLVVNKPSGLLSIRDGYKIHLPWVASILEPEYGKCWVVHRLDKETSGVMILARNKIIHRSLNILFESRKVSKTYHAFVYGILTQTLVEIDFPLRTNGDREHRTVVDYQNGKPAQTSVLSIKTHAGISFISAKPKTGYTHQIRAHLCAYGFPLLGDKLYKGKNTEVKIFDFTLPQRVALHAYEITFSHPVNHQLITVTAPYPEDFRSLLSRF